MDAATYYTMLLHEAHKAHRASLREARNWQYCLRDSCMKDAREWRELAHKWVGIIRQSRQELRQ